MTPWPGVKLPHPPLLTSSRYQLVDGVLLPTGDQNAPVRARNRRRGQRDPGGVVDAGEIYLELAALDLDSEDAIVSFANEYRTLSIRYNGYELVRDTPGFATLETEIQRSDTSHDLTPIDEPLDEFRYGARCVRDLRDARRFLDDPDGEPTPSWSSLPGGSSWLSPDELVMRQEHDEAVSPQDEAEAALFTLINPGLRYFQPRILASDFLELDSAHLAAAAPLYAICCLEVHNHILESASYRRCANQSCGRLFVRQVGRSAAGQFRRKKVIYCSNHCAQAEASRRSRQRKADYPH
jgi:hypothetical protein